MFPVTAAGIPTVEFLISIRQIPARKARAIVSDCRHQITLFVPSVHSESYLHSALRFCMLCSITQNIIPCSEYLSQIAVYAVFQGYYIKRYGDFLRGS